MKKNQKLKIKNQKHKVKNVKTFNFFSFCVCVFYIWFFIFGFSPDIVGAQEEAKISLRFKEVEIREALHQLAKEANINIIGGEEVAGRITVSLENVALTDALAAVLKGSGYTYEMSGRGILRIVPSATPPKRVEVGPGIFAQAFTLNYTEPDQIKETLNSLLPEGAKILIPKGGKTVVVYGRIAALNTARRIIMAIDTPPRQVMVEARIMELTYSTSNIQGVNLGYTNRNDPNDYAKTVGLANPPTASGAQGMYFSVSSMSMEALVETFRSRTGYNLLSSPRVLAIDGKKAEIITGQRLGYKTKTVTTTGLIETIEFMDVGTKLTIQPSVKDDGTIIMEIHPEVSTGQIVNELPQKDSTETTTTFSVKDGQTIVIGGMLKDYVQEVVKGAPFLMDIPILGALFRRTVADTQKKEIVVLISPHIIDVDEIARLNQEYHAMDQMRQKASEYQPLRLFR